MKTKVVASIDVGSSKICTLIGQPDENGETINIIGASSTPSSGIRKGQIVDIDEATESIIKSVEAAERMAGFSLNKVSVTVGGAHISSQNSHGIVAVSEPEKEITQEDINRVIDAAKAVSIPSSRELLHIIPVNYTVDSQEGVANPIGMSGVRLEVKTHLITGSTTSIKNLTKCVSEVGAEITNVVFAGITASQAVLTDTEKELGVILVDIGGGTTSIVVFTEGSPCYTTVLPIGAKNVTNDLAIGLRLSLEGAEKLKIALSSLANEENKVDDIDLAKIGIHEETKTVSRKTITEGIIKPRLAEIFNMVGEEIAKNGFAGLTPSGIVLTGGGALTVSAVETCRHCLSLPARVGTPGKIKGLIDDILDPAYASAIGLLFYSLDEKTYATTKSFPKFGEMASKIPIKGAFGKITSFVKSFLP